MMCSDQPLKSLNSRSLGSMPILSRDRLREKARKTQVYDTSMLVLCARIQRAFKKSPSHAETIAFRILSTLSTKMKALEIPDSELAALVKAAEVSIRSEKKSNLSERKLAKEDAVSWSSGDENVRLGTARRCSRDVEDDTYVSESHMQQRSVGFGKEKPFVKRHPDIWDDIVKYQAEQEQKEKQQRQEVKAQKRTALSKELNVQVQQKRVQEQNDQVESERYYQKQVDFLQALNDQDQEAVAQRQKLAKELNHSQQQQRREKAHQQKVALERRKAQENKLIQNIKREQKVLEEQEQAKRKSEKLRILQVLNENQAVLERKLMERMQEKKHEAELAQEYIRMEERKDEMRRKHLEDLTNNIKSRMKYFDDNSKAEMELKTKKEEERIQQYQLEYSKRQAEYEAARESMANARNKEQRVQLKQQMQEKRDREETIKKDSYSQAKQWKLEHTELEKQERAKENQKRLQSQAQQKAILEQMKQKEGEQGRADHTLLEIKLNRNLLEKIHQSSGTASLIAEAVAYDTHRRSQQLRRHEAALH